MNTLARSAKRVYVFLFVRKAFYSFHLLFYKLSMFGLGIRNHENEVVSGEKAFIRYLINRGKLSSGAILDIGANVGNYSIMLRNNKIRLPIYAFEPHPVAFRRLETAAAEYAFTAVPLGAGETRTTAAIYDYQGEGGSEHASMYKGVIEELHKGQAEAVAIELTTIDAFVAAHNISRIALLKIDTEGHELSVLKGAQECIRKGMAEAIQIEFNEMNVISRTFFKDIIDLLPGYDFYRLLPDGLKALGKYNTTGFEIFLFQNVVALKKETEGIRTAV
ncbi:FkbM family methyltransferase [Chitinophaga nivalis]|uniref:FkbM family methyltransferase n=1 Tax=Chitinophaga nivalis TaxID=2991709 RepID=A0ABT3IEP6_9BACT|nr:FkbM family methyltransferase [Chitinophaga nivalis]MCW3467881.1 FkbM family methyltransferase [Chitinophaga nivalis]MCW3482428.1 FkbM family methyltransferase [Chitinophaga nivalis]